ncbi:hypothetical protein [Acidipropionibacterium timonense]|uniref:hypothetical protein n=1 Tax=Acidipropionibacterium timonense TaxID=2161818 RepID=UPI001436775E|nr:hypothetical protein [Acidipropionibacterium timonense]
MCHRITCPLCGRPSWEGCGRHVEDALAGVARADRCPGHDPGEYARAHVPAPMQGDGRP